MSVKQENRWRRTLHLESQRLNDLKRQIEAASMERGPRPAAIKPVNDGARRRDVRAWMRANAHQYETATALAEAAKGAAAGAVGGAIVMGVLSAILGGGGHGRWAAAGAVAGGLQGAGAGEANQRAVVVRCMAGRGYRTLN